MMRISHMSTCGTLSLQACYRWFALSNPQGARIDANNVAIAGNSRAGYGICSGDTPWLMPDSAHTTNSRPAANGPLPFPNLWLVVGATLAPTVIDCRRCALACVCKKAGSGIGTASHNL